ncbi:8728_t:CDS:2 [Ambispora leptoticha]|uniref:RING-type E3 ubiquitin transferase n=1 Tax=Ambispora leptoticha TaxID=144679 RepID=A0A9N8V5J6_9GLOM|nr:8728_t:CDS:2 [Ambispora leptoticha]
MSDISEFNSNNPSNNNNSANRRPYWCHQCQREIEPLLAPLPTCPRCNSDFVEEIDESNDPREFAEHNTQEHETDDEFEDFGPNLNATPGGAGSNDVVQLLSNMIQSIFGPNAPLHVETRTYGDNGNTTTTTTTDQPQGNTRPNIFFTMRANGGQEGGGDARINAPMIITQVLQRAFGEGAQQGANNPWTNVFNMVGDPRDYVWGPGGLDNIISQLMEQQAGRQAPPPASEEMINGLPKTKISKKQEVEEQLNCPVCKDDFKEGEEATALPCNHSFHDECIRPWLKMNGTCPVCRNGSNGNFNTGSFNGNFNGNQTSSSQSHTNWNLPGTYPSTPQQNAQQNRQQDERDSAYDPNNIEPFD